MKDILKYLFFLVLGIILYILLNGNDGFSVGIPEYLLTIDNGIISIDSDDPAPSSDPAPAPDPALDTAPEYLQLCDDCEYSGVCEPGTVCEENSDGKDYFDSKCQPIGQGKNCDDTCNDTNRICHDRLQCDPIQKMCISLHESPAPTSDPDPKTLHTSERNPVIEINENRYHVYGNDIDEARRNFDVYIASRQSDAGGGGAIGDAGGAIGDAGGSACSVVSGASIPRSLRLSIQMHEFALFVHYQLTENPNFTFYVNPLTVMAEILEKTYGESLTRNQNYTPEEMRLLNNVYIKEHIRDYGTKIPFTEIFRRYSNTVPELYQFERFGESYKNNYGFQLLNKRENIDKIHAFYNIVRQYFCKIPFNEVRTYIHTLKDEYPRQNWEDFGTMSRIWNQEYLDALIFLEFMINNTDDRDELRKLLQYYINVFSVGIIKDVRNCQVGADTLEIDLKGIYMIVKLKNPVLDFVYDNTEMVVYECNFNLENPTQYHIGIMRNPSDLITNKFKKTFSSDKYDAIISLNDESRMF